MPISEDELEHGYGSHAHSYMHHGSETMSKAEQRRSNKPIMEKRRRARINHCLNELKTLILDAMKKDPARHSKLEKADILEMTVKHLQTIQRQQLSMAVGADPSVVHKFQTGFSECAGEVSRYVARMDNVEAGVRQRLVSHLASCVSGLQQMTPLGSTSSTSQGGSPEDVNNNTASARLQMMSGLQLIPSRLPSGEIALLLPNSQHLPLFPAAVENQVSTTTESATSVDRSRNSAFTAVGREKYTSSPQASPTSTTASSYGEESCDQPYPSPSHLPEVTSTSEPPRGVTEKGFTTYQPQKNEPQGLLQISLPNQEFSRLLPSTLKTINTPLTVITSNSIMKESQRFVDTRSQHIIKDPLDFSVKKDHFSNPFLPLKRPYREEVPDNLLMKSTDYQPSLKIPKVAEARSEMSPVERRSLFEIQNQPQTIDNQPQTHQAPERGHSLEPQNQPSTSSTSNEGGRDMWRPW